MVGDKIIHMLFRMNGTNIRYLKTGCLGQKAKRMLILMYVSSKTILVNSIICRGRGWRVVTGTLLLRITKIPTAAATGG